MKGQYKAVIEHILILGKMNDVNVQIGMKVEYDQQYVSGIDVINDITAKWHAGGLQPPVGKTERTHGEKQTGATGKHPDDLVPYIGKGGQHVLCPNCKKPLYIKTGITTKKDSKNYGQPWSKWYCLSKPEGCGAYNFGDRTDPRYD